MTASRRSGAACLVLAGALFLLAGCASDRDGDGFTADVDCDDAAWQVFPGAVEQCNGVDDDCDGAVDEDPADGSWWYADVDADGHGDADAPVRACAKPEGYVDSPDDCDDSDAAVSPEAHEACNGEDDDCDGAVDEAATDASTWHLDLDNDGFGDPDTATIGCPCDGWVADGTDCDDRDATVHPGADETCDRRDQDCDGAVDEEATDALPWYPDGDGDGFGDGDPTWSCAPPADHVAEGGDCADEDPAIFPGADELCNGVDDDCDGAEDEDGGPWAPRWYADVDGDGYGDATASTHACALPEEHSADPTDCDDGDGTVYPGADETCDDDDEDCDGAVDESPTGAPGWYLDGDGDGYGAGAAVAACDPPDDHVADGTDCDDGDLDVHPGATEVCNGVDDDCDDGTPEDGLAAFVDPDGALTDVTAWFTGTEGAPLDLTLSDEGELRLCAGTWYVNLDVEASLTLAGDRAAPGAVVLDGGSAGTVVAVSGDGLDVRVQGLTVQGGAGDAALALGTGGGGLSCLGDSRLALRDAVVFDNTAAAGAGIGVEGCGLALVDTVVESNSASGHGGGLAAHEADVDVLGGVLIGNVGGYGGALAVDAGSVDLVGTVLDANTASADGGAAWLDHADASIQDSLLTSHGAGDSGGALVATDSTLVLVGAEFSSGTAADGGALAATDCTVVIEDGQVHHNEVGGDGGGVLLDGGTLELVGSIFEHNGADRGGAIAAQDGTVVAVDTRLSNNEAGDDGGGLWSDGADVALTTCEVRDNDASDRGGGLSLADGDLSLSDTRVSGNQAAYGAGVSHDGGSVECIGSSASSQWGVVSNTSSTSTAGDSAALALGEASTFSADHCDLDGNSPMDVGYFGSWYLGQVDASFTCTTAGWCGTHHDEQMGARTDSDLTSGAVMWGNMLYVPGPASLLSIGFHGGTYYDSRATLRVLEFVCTRPWEPWWTMSAECFPDGHWAQRWSGTTPPLPHGHNWFYGEPVSFVAEDSVLILAFSYAEEGMFSTDYLPWHDPALGHVLKGVTGSISGSGTWETTAFTSAEWLVMSVEWAEL